MIILVTGGRALKDEALVYGALDLIKPTLIVHGGARGADAFAQRWAERHGVETKAYPISPDDWGRYGHSAGPIRNQKMLDAHPDIEAVVAFPGNAGTRDMIRRAKGQKFNVIKVGHDG